MNNEKWHLDPNSSLDQGLIDNFLAVKQAGPLQSGDEPCPQHQERESLIWAYADGFLTDVEEAEAWEKISQCRSCLARLTTVQRSLCEAEGWLEREILAEPEIDFVPMSIRILTLFDFKQVGETIRRTGQILAFAPLQPVKLLGEEEKPWEGQLVHRWNELQVKIKIEMYPETADQSNRLAVSVELQDRADRPISLIPLDFCDVHGHPIETRVTDEGGFVRFSSWERHRFTKPGDEKVIIGFCLKLTHGSDRASWQILVIRDELVLAEIDED